MIIYSKRILYIVLCLINAFLIFYLYFYVTCLLTDLQRLGRRRVPHVRQHARQTMSGVELCRLGAYKTSPGLPLASAQADQSNVLSGSAPFAKTKLIRVRRCGLGCGSRLLL